MIHDKKIRIYSRHAWKKITMAFRLSHKSKQRRPHTLHVLFIFSSIKLLHMKWLFLYF